MGLQIGIIGLPNVGKSTLFNALTNAHADAANYPFCTIEPNVGVVAVPDPRLEQIHHYLPREKRIPTSIQFVDIAGLVKGAHKGEGLGNQFLGHIRETHALLHVVRCFEDSQVVHVDPELNPLHDIEVIETELLLADLQTVENKLTHSEKAAMSSPDPHLKMEFHSLKKAYAALKQGQLLSSVQFEDNEKPFITPLQLLTQKPVLYVCNVNETDFSQGGNSWVDAVKKIAEQKKFQSMMVCGSLESELGDLTNEEQKEFLNSLGTDEPTLHRLIREAYRLLNLETFFTYNKNEIRAWTIRKNTPAPQSAGVIHSDFEKGFIRAEVFHVKDLLQFKSESAIKDSGHLRSEGKDYLVQDGDIILFRFNI